jgi:hypothetical protein
MVELNRALAALWGSRLDAFWFDVPGHRIELVVALVENDEWRRFRIEAYPVVEARFSSELRNVPWLYAEITQAEAVSVPEGLRLDMILWSEETSIAITAGNITVVEV